MGAFVAPQFTVPWHFMPAAPILSASSRNAMLAAFPNDNFG
jgi:hypothetical protein